MFDRFADLCGETNADPDAKALSNADSNPAAFGDTHANPAAFGDAHPSPDCDPHSGSDNKSMSSSGGLWPFILILRHELARKARPVESALPSSDAG